MSRKLARTFLSSVLFVTAFSAQGEYVAYSVANGKKTPLPENIDEIEPEFLLNVEYGKYSGNKTRIAVMPVQNRSRMGTISIRGPSGDRYYEHAQGGVPVDGIDAIITNILHRSGRFRLMERTKIRDVLQEQDFGTSGRVSKQSAAKLSKVLGAQFLMEAIVTDYDPNVSGQTIGGGGLLRKVPILGGAKFGSKKGRVAMSFRLINAESGEVTFSKQVDVTMSDSDFSLGGIGWGGGGVLGGSLKTYSKTPIGQAMIAAANKGAYELVKQVGSAPVTGSVAKVSGGKIYVNLAKGQVDVGDVLKVVRLGEAITDPDTGEILDYDRTELGTVRVVKALKNLSVCTANDITGQVKAKDRVTSTRAPTQMQFAAAWNASKSSGSGSTDEW